MKVLVISDLHGNYPALKAVLEDAGRRDAVVCLGDLAGYYPFVNEVVETVAAMDNLLCVMGNHDHVLLDGNATTGSRSADLALVLQRDMVCGENRRFLEGLPRWREEWIDGRRCFLFHGSPGDRLEGRDPFWQEGGMEQGIYLCGHRHRAVYETDPKGKWMVVNPGSCGLPRDGDARAAYAVLDTGDWRVDFRRVSYALEQVTSRCRSLGMPEVFCRSLEAGAWVPGQES